MFFSCKMVGETFMVILLAINLARGMPRPKDYRGATLSGTGEVLNNKYESAVHSEPSCDELRAMWRFSKRQSRAAEITNEIPTYRDPFSYNVWEPYYARSRSMGGPNKIVLIKMKSSKGHIQVRIFADLLFKKQRNGKRRVFIRSRFLNHMARGRRSTLRMSPTYRNRPVYGRVVHKVPSFRVQDGVERNRAFEEVARLYGTVQRGVDAPRRRINAFRYGGGGLHMPIGVSPQAGSFQHLKELIRTERARELQEQRMAEEVAARAAALKQISSGNNDRHRQQQNLRDSYTYSMEEAGGHDDDGRKSAGRAVLAFPDLLAPAARPEALEAAFVDPPLDYMYRREAISPFVPPYTDMESGLMV